MRGRRGGGGTFARGVILVVDVALGTVAAIVALPVVVIAALGSTVAFRAWPFVVQSRVGRHGRTFRFVKLRSLPRDTPPAIDKYALAEYRTSRWGRWLRATHVDELPQLFLVPLRRMNLVGPRPEMVALIDRYPADFAALRSAVHPGCTGLWQVSTASDQMIYEAPEYDTCFVECRSLRLNLWVLGQTLRVFFGGVHCSPERIFGERGPCRTSRRGAR